MLAVALLCAHQAFAQARDSITATTLEHWRQEMTAPIEAAAGRRFVERPRMKIISAGALRERQEHLARFGFREEDGAPRDTDVIGRYLRPTQEILFTPDAWLSLFRRSRLDEALLEPVAKCVAAHEMVHALTHAYAPASDDEVVNALQEGFADHVAGKVCGKGKRTLDVFDGAALPASRRADNRVTFHYGYAEDFVRVLEEVAGIEAVWAALGGAPVPRDLVERVATLGMPTGWADPSRLAPIGAAIADVQGWKTDAQVAHPDVQLLPILGKGRTVDALPAYAGLRWAASAGDHRVTTLAFLLRDETDAAAWLRERRAAITRREVWSLFRTAYTFERVGARAVPALAKLDGVTDTFALRTDVSGDWAYLEQWVVRGRYLLGAAVFDAKPDARRLTEAMAALVALDLGDVPPDASLSDADRAAILALAPPTPPTPTVRWEYRLDQQYPAMLEEDWSACLAGVEEALGAVGEDDDARAGLASGGARCAIAAKDLAAATRLLKAGGWRADATTATRYAALLADHARWSDALTVLPPAEGPRAGEAADVELRAHVGLKRWSDVERLVTTSGASLDARLAAATALAAAGRAEAARAALAAACGTDQAEARTRCESARTAIGR